MSDDYTKKADLLFSKLEVVTYDAFLFLNDEDKELFGERLRQISDAFYSDLFRKQRNSCFEEFVLINKE